MCDALLGLYVYEKKDFDSISWSMNPNKWYLGGTIPISTPSTHFVVARIYNLIV